MLGVCAGGTIPLCLTWVNEFMPVKDQITVTTLVSSFDASVMIIQSLYYAVHKECIPMHAFSILFSICIFIAVSFIPESPKWYYAVKRYDEAR